MAEAIVGNFAEVMAAFTRVTIRVDAADEVVEGAGADIVARFAAEFAPRLTGHLAASTDDEGGVVIADTPYAGYVEWGTRHNKAQPFMRPAAAAGSIPYREAAERIYTIATR